MKYILHVGAYDFDIKDSSEACHIAETLKESFSPDRYHDKVDISVEFQKEEE